MNSQHSITIKSNLYTNTIHLVDNVYSIGRHSSNSIVIKSHLLSRHHATIVKVKYNNTEDNFSYWIIDGDLQGNKSTNGITVNNQRVSSYELKNQDKILIANHVEIDYHCQAKERTNLEKLDKIDNFKLPIPDESTKTIPIYEQDDFLNRLNNGYDLVSYGIIELNKKGKIIYINETAELKFRFLQELQYKHPAFTEIVEELNKNQDKVLVSEIQIEKFFLLQYAHYLKNEQLIRIYLIDLNEQKRIEMAAKENEEKYKAVVKQIGESIILVDFKEKRVLECNQAYCNLSGYSLEEALSLTIYDLILMDDEVINSYLNKIIQIQQPLSLESLYQTKDGSVIDVEINLSLINYYHQEVFCLAARDIRERKQVERKLAEQNDKLSEAKKSAEIANQSKSKFLAIINHELRTPMNGIMGMTNMLRQTDLNSDQKHYVEVIQKSGEILLHIINDVLDYAKFESGKVKTEKIKFTLESLVKEIADLIIPQININKVKFSYNIDKNLPSYYQGDANLIKQILLNLLSNAVKFTEQGEIKLVIREQYHEDDQSYEIQFLVEDTGIGITPKNHKKIFEPFSQGQNSVGRKYGGTGLGLAICKHLCEIMGGRIWVVSKGVVSGDYPLDFEVDLSKSKLTPGSSFYFTVKLKAISENPTSLEPETSKNLLESYKDQLSCLKILLAEDNKINQRVVSLMLRKYSCKLEVVDNGLEAVNKLQETDYDAVLMDIEMPKMDGIQATEEIRKNYKNLEKPWIIAVTAYTFPEEQEKCLKVGMNDYISKPIIEEKLVEALVKVKAKS